MRFTRTLSVKHHPTDDHYSLAIPAQVAQAIGLDVGAEGGAQLVSLSVEEGGAIALQAYKDSNPAWRERFDPVEGCLRPVPVPPLCLGRSRPTACGEVRGMPDFNELRSIIGWCNTAMKEFRRCRPRRRGR